MVGTPRPSFFTIAQSAPRSIERGQHAAMGVAALGIDHPFLAPGRGQLDAVVMEGDDLEAQPFVVGRARDQFLRLSSVMSSP